MAPNSKINLKDKVIDGEMDLSLSNLQEVPVREIASFKKVFSLDLSNNHLAQLPKNFSTLNNLTKLDLSKNKLKRLPENFGDLTRLQYLDLYKNEIQHLPLSFGNLKGLRWLDLKDNPLVPAIREAAGDCLDTKQCQECAANMIYFFTKLKEKVEEDKLLRERRKEKEKQELAEKEKLEQLQQQQLLQQQRQQQLLLQQQQQERRARRVRDRVKNEDEEIIPSEKSVSKTSSDTSVVDESKSSTFKIFSYIILIQITLGILLFILTSIKYERTLFIEHLLTKYWNVFLNNAPSSIAHCGREIAHYVTRIHANVGEHILDLQNLEGVTFCSKKFNELLGAILNGE